MLQKKKKNQKATVYLQASPRSDCSGAVTSLFAQDVAYLLSLKKTKVHNLQMGLETATSILTGRIQS